MKDEWSWALTEEPKEGPMEHLGSLGPLPADRAWLQGFRAKAGPGTQSRAWGEQWRFLCPPKLLSQPIPSWPLHCQLHLVFRWSWLPTHRGEATASEATHLWNLFQIPSFFFFSVITLLLFNYSCLHFPTTTPPHPSQTHLPPWLPPSPLVLSLCPL